MILTRLGAALALLLSLSALASAQVQHPQLYLNAARVPFDEAGQIPAALDAAIKRYEGCGGQAHLLTGWIEGRIQHVAFPIKLASPALSEPSALPLEAAMFIGGEAADAALLKRAARGFATRGAPPAAVAAADATVLGDAANLARLIERVATGPRCGQPVEAPKPTGLAAALADPKQVEVGKAVYMRHCVACHGAQGRGRIGGDLADGVWNHGGTPEGILRTINEGVPRAGMVGWARALKQEDRFALVAFVLSLGGQGAR